VLLYLVVWSFSVRFSEAAQNLNCRMKLQVGLAGLTVSLGTNWYSIDRLLDENRVNVYEHIVFVHEHVWRTLCSVCATGARVAHPVPCNS
jgi:hypothetical protein